MNLLTPRTWYKPFQYAKAYEFWELQQQSFWVHHEINMDQDIYDWKFNLTDAERSIIGNILKSFVQSEVLIGDYWRKLGGIFQIPELGMMTAAFSSFETIHIAAYAYLNDTLGIDDWQEFLQDEVVMRRLSQLSAPPEVYESSPLFTKEVEARVWHRYRKDLGISLAVFSAFGEGVALFSAFTILLSFAQRGLMKGLGQIIEMSIRDESLHAKAGVWLFNTFINENKDVHGIKKPIYEAGRITVQMEEKFIDHVFKDATLPNCTAEDLKEFIKQRCNNQLRALHLKPEYRIDKNKVKNLAWFNLASSGDQHADFFASRVTQYAKTSGWNNMWEI
jgi:ribonucleoside-diphosphate reductase beta chain